MRRRRFCFVSVFACFFSFLCCGTPHQDPTIKVLLVKSGNPLELETSGGKLQCKAEESVYWTTLPNSVTINFDRATDQIHVGTSRFSHRTLLFRVGDGGNESWTLAGKRWRGVLQVSQTVNQLAYVLRVPLERYTEGVVLAELGGRAEFEALKAQAVAARTFALHRFLIPRHTVYDVDSSTLDQVFSGFSTNSLVGDAVKATKGEYLYYNETKSGRTTPPPFKAFFHSRCAGQTASAKEVWLNPEGNHFVSAPCEYCQKNHYRWQASVSLEELVSALKMPLSPLEMENSKITAGRVLEIAIKGSGKPVFIRAEELRRRLGFTRLQSSHFSWQMVNSNFIFMGTGAGHGVGLCQWGARGLARLGKTYQEILAHYYAGSHLFRPEVKISSQKTPSPSRF